MTLPDRLARLPSRWRWALHNLVGHPLSELLFQLGAWRLADAVHDATAPAGATP
ncbi:MAG: hypothetical protein JWM10_3016 [Myxococcaceae bacterium]|nr:hypothetical protein [Myxococcaceae bacterium]